MSGLFKHPKTGIFYYRKTIPEGLRDTFGRREIKKSLGTKDREQAKVLNHHVGGFALRMLQEAESSADRIVLRSQLDDFINTDLANWDAYEATGRLMRALVGPKLIEDRVTRYADKWLHWLLVSGKVGVDYEGTGGGIRVDGLTRQKCERLIEEYIDSADLRRFFQDEPDSYDEFCTYCWEHAENLDHVEPWPDLATVKSGAPIPHDAMPKAINQPLQTSKTTLSEGFEMYLKDRQPRPRTRSDWQTARERLQEFLGGDRCVDQINDEDVRDFRDAMLRYPSRVTAELEQLSFTERCDRAGSEGLKCLHPKTVNKNLNALSACFRWLVQNRYLKANPAEGIRAGVSRNPEPARLPFSNNDLKLVFGAQYPKSSPQADFWLPWIALYSGARMEEIGKLRSSDFHEINGTPYFEIGGTVKTAASRRRVPVHRRLVSFGLLDLVEERRQSEELLFDGLRPAGKGEVTAAYSKRFSRYLRKKVGVEDRRKVFHSFRHRFKDECRESDIPVDVQNALLGHSASSVGEGYGSGYSVTKLSEWLNRIEYRCLPTL